MLQSNEANCYIIFGHPVFNHRFNLKEACKSKVKMNSLIFEHESQVDHRAK